MYYICVLDDVEVFEKLVCVCVCVDIIPVVRRWKPISRTPRIDDNAYSGLSWVTFLQTHIRKHTPNTGYGIK